MAAVAVLGLVSAAPARAATDLPEVRFNADFLQSDSGEKVDVARFAKGNPVLPGDYLVDFEVNGQWVDRLRVHFAAQPGSSSAAPCIDMAMLAHIGLDSAALPAAARLRLASRGCIDIAAIITDAAVAFDQSTLKLSLSLPQALLHRKPRGFVSPQMWDRGVPSATLAYDVSVFRADNTGRSDNLGAENSGGARLSGATTTSIYAGLTGGVNLGDWHFRERSSLSGTDGHWRFQNVAAYVQRDLPRLRSSLTIGDSFTDGAVFDSFGFRGITLASDDRMRPESQQGYAPIIHGIARSNARVRVTQNGNLLVETTVSPGPFAIDDLYPTGYGGDLLVTVLEADGSQESFTVTYASLVQLLRAKMWRYSIAAGDLDVNSVRTSDRFAQLAVQHGISNSLTAYAGVQVAPGYTAGLLGTAVNTPLGAVAVDATIARADIPTGAVPRIAPMAVNDGYSVELSYSKIVPGLLTNIAVAAYRYSSSGFWSMQDAMDARAAANSDNIPISRQRSRFQINLTQSFAKGWGSLYLTGSSINYWNHLNTVTQLQAGYSNVAPLGRLNLDYGIVFSRQRSGATGQIDDRLLVNLSLALGEKANAPRATASLAEDRNAGQSETEAQLALNGTLGEHGEFSYGADLDTAPGATSVALNGGYRAPFATLSASASKGTGFNQLSFGASGGVVAHRGGVTLANQLSDTIGIVEAKGARGASVASGTGARIDGAGYAIVPYLMPYRENEVSIDPQGASAQVELQTTSQQVAPHANAVVLLKYATVSGQGVMIALHRPDGAPVPFGASVLDGRQIEIGLVAQAGEAFVRGIAKTGRLQVRWGDGAQDQCRFDYILPATRDPAAVLKISAICRTEAADTQAAPADLGTPPAAPYLKASPVYNWVNSQ